MKNRIDVNQIVPKNQNLLVSITKLDKVKDGIFDDKKIIGDSDVLPVEYYVGKVLAVGEKVLDKEQCPELKLNDYVFFSQFSGYIAPTSNTFSKIITGYDIVAILTDPNNMNTETIKPSNDRILVEIINESLVKDGIYDNTQDPTENLTQKGKVISCGVNAENYEVGTIVHFEPFCGSDIVRNKEQHLKTVNSLDILFHI